MVDERLLEDAFAGARFAEHQAKAALLGVDAEDVEDFLLMSEQRDGFGVERMALEAKVGADHINEFQVGSFKCSDRICGASTVWRRRRIGGRWFSVVGHGIKQTSLAHALAFVINDDATGRLRTLETDLDGPVRQMARSFPAERLEGEGIVGANGAVFLDEEEFVVGFVGRQAAEAAAVQRETIQRGHFQDGMFLGVVTFFDPMDELAVESVERSQIQRAGKELFPNGAEESFDFSLRRSVAHRRVMEQAADAGADLDDFPGRINGAVINVEGLRDAAFVKSGAQGFDERVHIFRKKELSVATNAAGIVEESDEPGLDRGTLVLKARTNERVGLPHFIGMGLGESQADFVRAFGVGLEQLVLLDHAAEGGVGDLRAGEQPLFNTEAIQHGPAGIPAVELWQHFADGVHQVFDDDLADFALVGAGLVFHFRDAVFFETGIPGLDGAPGELARMAILVGEGHLADGFDAGVDGVAGGQVNGAQHPHFQIHSGIAHE